mmetsp:Transcript_20849/g.50467  ORF Transcript_20849/g.50467 Transcript_20849/m.50467 type:complete len:138 (+) Transcript_20849:2-415(+)
MAQALPGPSPPEIRPPLAMSPTAGLPAVALAASAVSICLDGKTPDRKKAGLEQVLPGARQTPGGSREVVLDQTWMILSFQCCNPDERAIQRSPIVAGEASPGYVSRLPSVGLEDCARDCSVAGKSASMVVRYFDTSS